VPRRRLVTRRDLLRLAAAGAAGLALPGCPTSRDGGAAPGRSGPPGGRIHGQDDALGHLLRSGALAERPVDRTERVPALVVGAGVAGLSCAWRLRRAGLDEALVLDAGPEPGGNARGGANEVSAYPWGAHYLRAPTREHPGLERFLEESGLIRGRDAAGRPDFDTRAVCAAPLERLWEDGLWGEGLFPPPLSAVDPEAEAELTRFEEVVAAAAARRDARGRRAFAIPIARAAPGAADRALDALSFGAWLDREGFESPALRWFLEYAVRDDYGCSLATTSAYAGLHYFAARRDDADPDSEVILTWPEGNARLVELLRTTGGAARFRGRHLCFGLEPGPRPDAPSAARVYDAARDEVVRYEAEHLVWAGPRFLLERLLAPPPAGLAAFTYAPWVVANVTLERPPGGAGAPLAWDNVFYGAASLGYVVANREAARRGKPTVVTWYRPFSGPDPAAERRRLLELDHAAITDLVLTELHAAHPELEGRVRAVDAWRWGHAMVRPVPGFLFGSARAAALAPGPLLSAHSDLSGIPIFEEAFFRGVAAAEEVLRRAGRLGESILEGP